MGVDPLRGLGMKKRKGEGTRGGSAGPCRQDKYPKGWKAQTKERRLHEKARAGNLGIRKKQKKPGGNSRAGSAYRKGTPRTLTGGSKKDHPRRPVREKEGKTPRFCR